MSVAKNHKYFFLHINNRKIFDSLHKCEKFAKQIFLIKENVVCSPVKRFLFSKLLICSAASGSTS